MSYRIAIRELRIRQYDEQHGTIDRGDKNTVRTIRIVSMSPKLSVRRRCLAI